VVVTGIVVVTVVFGLSGARLTNIISSIIFIIIFGIRLVAVHTFFYTKFQLKTKSKYYSKLPQFIFAFCYRQTDKMQITLSRMEQSTAILLPLYDIFYIRQM
jgi:hypothetical protein